MSNQEKLFAAIGSTDPELLLRSGQRRRKRWPGYCLAAAACLALVLAAGPVLLWWTDQGLIPQDGQTKPEEPPSSWTEPFLPPHGEEIGTLRLLSYAPQSPVESVDFLIYINEEQFYIYEDNNLYSIRSINPLPESFPECSLNILHLPETSSTEAKESAEEALKDYYAETFSQEKSTALPDSLYLRASNGTNWDSEQAELWFVNDGQGGTFVLTAQYFLEAEEGIGARFRDMASSFRVVSLSEVVPDWMRELHEAVDRLFLALFTGDLTEVSGLLADGCDAEGYGMDVWADVTIASVDYALDSGQDPTRATVSVKHHLNQAEGDSFNYLTMELLRQEGQWFLCRAGIE